MSGWIIAVLITLYVIVGIIVALINVYLEPPTEHALKHDPASVTVMFVVLILLWPAVLVVYGFSRFVCGAASRGRARRVRLDEAQEAAESEHRSERGGAIQGGFSD